MVLPLWQETIIESDVLAVAGPPGPVVLAEAGAGSGRLSADPADRYLPSPRTTSTVTTTGHLDLYAKQRGQAAEPGPGKDGDGTGS